MSSDSFIQSSPTPVNDMVPQVDSSGSAAPSSSFKQADLPAVEQPNLICTVCGKPIADFMYGHCSNCGKVYHVVCLKRKSSQDGCQNHYLNLKRRDDTA